MIEWTQGCTHQQQDMASLEIISLGYRRAVVASSQRCEATSYPERDRTKVQCANLSEGVSNLRLKAFMKNRKNYIARSTATLTQSGLLAALLQLQRRKVLELAQRRGRSEQARGLLRNSLSWLLVRYHTITSGRRFRRGVGGETIPRHT